MILALASILAACQVGGGCPQSVEEALASATAADGDGFIAVGRVARFVNSPDVSSRGYDLDIWRGLVGSPSSQGTFLVIEEEVRGIGQGDPVLVVGQVGVNERTIRPGRCEPLVRITEEELLRWEP